MEKGMVKYFLVSSIASVIAINAHAVGNGFYMGLMMGPATNNGGIVQAQVFNPNLMPGQNIPLTPASPKSSQFGSSVYMGYQFSTYAAFEGGFTYYSSVHYDTKGVQTCSGTDARVRDIHLLGKGIFPLGNYFDVFGKAGVAVTYTTTSGSFNPEFGVAPDGKLITCGKNTHNNKFSPAYGVGASYNINQSWVTDASWTRTQVGGVLNSVDLYALGISYHFVDRYCGQFLCDD
jgi:opacity protein-like surface antigen